MPNTTPVTSQDVGAPSPAADRVGRGLMAFDSLSTLVPFIGGLVVLGGMADDRVIAESWRTFGYFVFVGLWAMLALWPRKVPGIWELVLFQKIAVTVHALTVWGVPESQRGVIIDGVLVATTIAAYVLCRGWQSWRGVTLPGIRRAAKA